MSHARERDALEGYTIPGYHNHVRSDMVPHDSKPAALQRVEVSKLIAAFQIVGGTVNGMITRQRFENLMFDCGDRLVTSSEVRSLNDLLDSIPIGYKSISNGVELDWISVRTLIDALLPQPPMP